MSKSLKTYLEKEENNKLYFNIPEEFIVNLIKSNEELENYLIDKILSKLKNEILSVKDELITEIESDFKKIEYHHSLKVQSTSIIQRLKEKIKENLLKLKNI